MINYKDRLVVKLLSDVHNATEMLVIQKQSETLLEN